MNIRFPLFPRAIRWGFVGVIGLVIVYFSIITAPPETPIDTVRFELIPLDKWRHFVAYAAFAGSLAYATTEWQVSTWYLALAICLVTIFFGFGIEVAQSFYPNRYFSLLDAYANGIGAVLVLPWFWLTQYLEFIPVSRLASTHSLLE